MVKRCNNNNNNNKIVVVISSSIDGKVRNYDLRMGQLRVECISQPVTSVSFTKDGQCVLVSTLDNTIRLLDKDSGELLNE